MTGARKSALLLLSLSKEDAAEILKHLDDKSLEAVILEMSKIRYVSKKEKEEILSEFHTSVSDISQESRAGEEVAKELLEGTIGKDRAQVILSKLSSKSIDSDFAYLNDIDPTTLYGLLHTEAPQTIAVTLSFLDPKKAANVLKIFPSDLQAKIAYRLANTSKTHPDAIREIARIIKKRYEARDSHEYSESGGTEALANILNHMEKGLEDVILRELEENSPDLADQVRDKLYTFEDLMALDKKEMRVLINRLQNDETISIALRGSSNEMKDLFFSAMSQNKAYDIIDSMDMRGKVTLREINESRSTILNLARRLEDDGLIIFKKTKEEYI
ncbi:flagellar motor switch protein FliG [Leptospira sp. GIMC2001]|uniref:flagellar motor switch protein FliG n=1 Tax=Leptospira sp. GIMC2001 TaxID=1513297 RepID=UPI0004A5C362|nr:flagellar motor switch protein FliG [Leptospira sp. GIMC2001]AID56248.1 flagellar motor switch protein FliG [Leptospira sp. GIMC2001]WCL48072.1 flagellar motor switch protein FliG [Leptospira sp. GIMC2001]